MPYTLEWYQPGRIILFKLTGQISDAEVERSSYEIHQHFLEQGQAPIHILYDTSDMTDYSRNLIFVRQTARSYLKHARLGWLILYGPDNLTLQFLARVVSQIMRVQFRYVPTKEAALSTLYQIDLSLNEATS